MTVFLMTTQFSVREIYIKKGEHLWLMSQKKY